MKYILRIIAVLLIGSFFMGSLYSIDVSAQTEPETEEATTTESEVSEEEPSEPESAESEETEATTTPETSTSTPQTEDPETASSTDSANATSSDTIATSTSTTTDETNESTSTTTQATSSPETSTSTVNNNSQDSEDEEETAATSTAATSTTDANPTIVSGQSIALANILNLVNSNFINSNGVILFSNFFDYVSDSIDFRDYFTSGMCTSTPCTTGEGLALNISNNATIENDVTVEATTGNNLIEGGNNASITTGNAYAGLNLINLINTNVVDSNYLLVTLNAFEGVGGDVVFPSLSTLFNILGNSSSPSSIELTSDANVENNVHVDADSGNNETEGADSSTIETGDANSSTNVFNEINSTIAGGRNISILFRIDGEWAGEIFGAPENLLWTEGDDGSIYLFDSGSGGRSGNGDTDISGSNSALIDNDVSVIALTGDNRIEGAQTALISTGNALAGANLLNVANSNVIGRNWILAVINIFGGFTGDIAFGRPDLWVGEQVSAPSKVEKGDTLEYTFSVLNNGDSDSTQTVLTDVINDEVIEILSSSHPYEKNGNTLVWNLGTLPAGAGTEISYKARITRGDDDDDITNEVSISGRETDNNTIDNKDMVTIDVVEDNRRDKSESKRRARERERNERTALETGAVLGTTTLPISSSVTNGIAVTRTTAQAQANGHMARQELIIKNLDQTQTMPVKLFEIMQDPQGNVAKVLPWDLQNILPNEEITIGYDVEFNGNAQPGSYTFSSILLGDGVRNNLHIGNGSVIYIKEEDAPTSQ